MFVSHFLTGDAFGAPTGLPWRFYLWNEYRHPSQIYEILASVGVLVAVLRRPLGGPGQGINFLLVVALSTVSHLSLEVFRGDRVIWFGCFRAAQIGGLLVLVSSMWLMQVWTRPQIDALDDTDGGLKSGQSPQNRS